MAPGLRRFLYVTAGLTGAAILIVEILGAKLLAPYLGTSHFVWTAQIAVTLLSLAMGYAFGGWLVDRSPKLSRLYACILVAGVYLALSVPFCESVAFACLRFRLALGSLLASTFLFLIPLTLLATTGPFLVRILSVSLGTVGRQAGRISAISTMGSTAGAVLIGYAVIPLLPNSISMLLTAALLLLLGALYFFTWGRRLRQQPGAVIALLAGALGLTLGLAMERRPRSADLEELIRVNSNFGMVQVLQTQDGLRRYYLNDYLVQNTYDVTTRQSTSLFTYMLHDLAVGFTPNLRSALCIGLGIGVVPTQLARAGIKVDVVEINSASPRIATQFFDFDPQRVTLILNDGRHHLNATAQRYDTVILDAFLGDSSPSHLMSREAFRAVDRVLEPQGTLVINCFGDFHPQHDYFTASLDRTLRDVFPTVRIFATDNGNVFFLASKQQTLSVVKPPRFEDVHPSVREQARWAWEHPRDFTSDHGRILTDDFNPIEYYDAANRERIRRQFAYSARSF